MPMESESKISEYANDLFELFTKKFKLEKTTIEVTPSDSLLLKCEKDGYSVFIEVYEDGVFGVPYRDFNCNIFQGKKKVMSTPVFKSARPLHDHLEAFFSGNVCINHN